MLPARLDSASNAEAEHAKLYGNALNNLQQWPVGKAEFSV